jgi:hypothetical protein
MAETAFDPNMQRDTTSGVSSFRLNVTLVPPIACPNVGLMEANERSTCVKYTSGPVEMVFPNSVIETGIDSLYEIDGTVHCNIVELIN